MTQLPPSLANQPQQPSQPRNKQLATKWKDVDGEGLRSWLASPYAKKLIEILKEGETALSTPKTSDYDNPNWAYKQADTCGRLAMINIVKDLLLQ